jgi:hypothetical protein
MSFVLTLFATFGNTTSAFGSPAGVPPVQFALFDQSELTAPVQVCVAAARLADRTKVPARALIKALSFMRLTRNRA